MQSTFESIFVLHLKTIKANTFNASNIDQELYLNSNQIQRIESDAFKTLDSLSYLFLNDNNITNIQPNGLAGVRNASIYL